MTTVENNLNLNDFIQGKRAGAYIDNEEHGFLTTGNIQALLNSDLNILKNVKDGILVNTLNETDHSNNLLGKIKPSKNDWVPLKRSQPFTPQIYWGTKHSELLPYYPNTNNIPNLILSPDNNLQVDGQASPTIYGNTMAFINDVNVITNPHNDIGHQIEAHGLANHNGLRALPQGKNICKENGKLTSGYNVPVLKVEPNQTNKTFVANPTQSIPYPYQSGLYQVGDWTKISPNFIQEFNKHAGIGCNTPYPPSPTPPGPRPPGPTPPGPRPPRPRPPSGPGARYY